MIDTMFLKAQLGGGASPVGRRAFLSLTPPGGWPRRDEFSLVYQSDTTDFTDGQVVFAYVDGDDTVEVPASLEPESIHYFAFQNVGRFGQVSELSAPLVVIVAADGAADMAVGNIPHNFAVRLLSGGKVKLTWSYDQAGQPETPDGFSIELYTAGEWTPQDTVLLNGYSSVYLSRLNYNWISATIAHGTTTTWRLRAFRVVGETTYYGEATENIQVTTDAEGPASVVNISLG